MRGADGFTTLSIGDDDDAKTSLCSTLVIPHAPPARAPRRAPSPRRTPVPPPVSRWTRGPAFATGGSSTVHLGYATQGPSAGLPVALKCLHPHLARRPAEVAALVDEARLAMRLAHPNVCRVLDAAPIDDTWAIAMEYLPGVSLSVLGAHAASRPEISRTRIWARVLASLFADAAEGLHALHEMGDEAGRPLEVVHRDATPHNVMVTWDGAVKIVDLGIAVSRGRAARTQPGMLRGKVGFVSPEQMRGEPLTRRSDVWSLGVGLWELLTQRRLFARGSDAQTFEAIASMPVPPPSALAPWVPPALDRIVLAALARDPLARPATARALAEALRGFVLASGAPLTGRDRVQLLDALYPGERAASEARLAGARIGARASERPGRPSPFEPEASPASLEVRVAAGAQDFVARADAFLYALADAAVARARALRASAEALGFDEASRRTAIWAVLAVLVVSVAAVGMRSALRASRHHHAPARAVVVALSSPTIP